MEFDAEKTQLTWDQAKQTALLGHLLENERFFVQARGKLKPEWFVNSYDAQLFKARLDFYDQFKRCPTREELFDVKALRMQEQAAQAKLRAQAGLAVHQSTQFRLDNLSLQLTNFMRANKLAEAMFAAEKLYNKENADKACDIIKEFGRTIDDIQFETKGSRADFGNVGFIGEIQRERTEGLTFGLEQMDRLMNPHGKGGGLFIGDTTLLLAPPNVGKTTAMITIATANLSRGKNVLFLTHEGAEKDIMLKFWQCCTRRTQGEVFALYNSGHWQDDARVKAMTNLLATNICYLPLNKAGQNVDEVEAIIRKKQEEWQARYGRGFDLLVDDYPAKLSTREQKGGSWARRQVDDLIYNRFVDLAGELKFHALLAIQANREASKINRGMGKEVRLLGMEDASESFGPMASATNVISLNRNPSEPLMKYKNCKTRSSSVGQTVICESAFEVAVTHANDLPWTWFPSDLPEVELADHLLKVANHREATWQEAAAGFQKSA